MTGSEFYTYLLKKWKRTDKETESYQAMTDIIADMRLRFNSEDFKTEDAITGISTLGEYKLDVPSDYAHIIGSITFVDPSGNQSRVLKKISKQKYDLLYRSRLYDNYGDKNSGVPVHFCVYGEEVFIGPVPDSVSYTYYMNHTTEDYTEMASGTADVPFTDRYRNILRAGVMAELHDGVENYEESTYWENKYLSKLELVISNDTDNINDSVGVQYHGF